MRDRVAASARRIPGKAVVLAVKTIAERLQVQNALDFASGINEMQKNMQAQHEEMLALISACSTRPSSVRIVGAVVAIDQDQLLSVDKCRLCQLGQQVRHLFYEEESK